MECLDYFSDNGDTRLLHERQFINGVWIYPRMLYISHDDWYSDLINRTIPKMGRMYMELFIRAHYNPHTWLDLIEAQRSIDV